MKAFTNKEWKKYKAKQLRKFDKESDTDIKAAYEHGVRSGREESNDFLAAALWEAIGNNPENEPGAAAHTVEVKSELIGKIHVQIGHRFSHESRQTIYLFPKELLPDE